MPSRLFWLLRPASHAGMMSMVEFQCRLGFFGFCDTYTSVPSPRGKMKFQCRLGFSGFCDRPPATRPRSSRHSFNAVSAFLASATWLVETNADGATVFQCRLGFSGFCDLALSGSPIAPSPSFQCRLGFSGFCDRASSGLSGRGSCFNAVSAFLASATLYDGSDGWYMEQFQCRLGFSGFCD